MNSKSMRLGIGWVFLMLLTAAGVFYAADELDQRGSLDKYALHEKLGYARMASVQTPPPAPQPPLQPQVQTPPPPGQQQIQPPPQNPPAQPFQQVQQNNPNQQYTQQQLAQQQLYQQQQAQLRQQQQYQQPPPRLSPVQQPPVQQPVQQPQPARAAMNPALRDRLTDVESQTEAVTAQWQPILNSLRSMGQSPRPEIMAALSSMRRYEQQAQALARSGDIPGANHALDMAEKQMAILKQARE